MQPIIEIKNLGKKYNLMHQRGGYVALRDVLTNVIKNPFRFLKSKAKQVVGLDAKEEFWALKDINFSIMPGEVIGIIGHNGACKSTLLKILSQITPPTTGEIKINGSLGSLLEVGTGFHPELTGRENIILNGAILGMSRKEIEKKFDQIIEFAGIEKFLDTPVKYYSSGMYVRLAFSVAAHLEPDILLVDEVLAVGDAKFQKKCLGKMEEVTQKEGRTILFVSHNLGAIQRLCKKTILLEQGSIKKIDDTTKVIDEYLKKTKELTSMDIASRKDRTGNQDLKIIDCYLKNEDVHKSNQAISGKKTTVVFEYKCKPGKKLSNVIIGANITNPDGITIFFIHNQMTGTDLEDISGQGKLECEIPRLSLTPGTYFINARIAENNTELDYIFNLLKIEVLPGDFFGTGSSISTGMVFAEQKWTHKK